MKSEPVTRPPRSAEWLARRAAPGPDWREVSAGDLHEEFQAIAAARGARAARRWYWRQARSAVVEQFGRRLRQALAAARRVIRPRGDSMMASLVQEIRGAFRALIHQPLVGAIVIVTLALGLGANIATFGMIDALVLRPFLIPDVDRLVMFSENSADDAFPTGTISPDSAHAYEQPMRTLEGVAACGWWDVNLAGSNEPERIQGFRVSTSFFSLLRVTPALGRALDANDAVWGRHQRVVISDGLWKRRFGADRGIVGRTIRLDGLPHEVVGVAPPAFVFPQGSEIWAPLSIDPADADDRTSRYLTLFARLAPGATIEQAEAEVTATFTRLTAERPDHHQGRRLVMRTFTAGMIDVGMPQILGLWQAAAFLVLLIGCTNIANLLLARGAARQRELAVRLAIGASRWRVVRQLLVESMVLALVATPAALAVAAVVLTVLRSAMPATLIRFVPGWDRMHLNPALIVAAFGAALLTAIVFGLLPALQASRPNLVGALRDGGRSVSGAAGRSRLRRGLVVAEIALALPLLIASGLAAVGAQRFASGPQGYDPAGILRLRTILPESTYQTPEARLSFAERLAEGARQIPGVQLSGTSSVLPASGSNSQRVITIDGRPADPVPISINYRTISPDYLAVLRVPILQGRAISAADRAGTEPVVVVSQSAARRFWPDEPALGRRLKLGGADRPWLTVVGVAGDTIDDWFVSRKEITAFVPVAQAPSAVVNLVVRTDGDPAALANAARRLVTSVDPAQPAFDVMTMGEALRVRTTGLRFVSGLMAGFGVLALLLATVGIYSVMAFHVAQRRHEVGIRMALGATARDILRLTVGHGARMASLGIAIGLGLGVALARLMQSALFGIVAVEPWLFASITAILALAALAASLLPARLATKVDPANALRA